MGEGGPIETGSDPKLKRFGLMRMFCTSCIQLLTVVAAGLGELCNDLAATICGLTGMMVSKENYPKIAVFQVSESE